MRNDIPSGHQLQITSWENDADAYGTKVLSGLTPNDVKFYLELLKPFASRHNGGLYGNGGVETAELLMHFMAVFNKHKLGLSAHLYELYSELNEDTVYEFVTELLGYPAEEFYATNYTNFCRVFSSFKVVYFQTAGKDVTSQFE